MKMTDKNSMFSYRLGAKLGEHYEAEHKARLEVTRMARKLLEQRGLRDPVKKVGSMKNYDLNVGTPHLVPEILRNVAQAYRESAGELESAWQDKHAGKIWTDYAVILERAADSAERAGKRRDAY